MQRRRRINPNNDAAFYAASGKDKAGLELKYISGFKGKNHLTDPKHYLTFEYLFMSTFVICT